MSPNSAECGDRHASPSSSFGHVENRFSVIRFLSHI